MNRNLLFAVVLLAAGCHTLKTVPDAELAPLGGQGLEAVEAARADEAAAREALEARRAEAQAALRGVRIAEWSIRRDEASLAIARLRFEAAQETQDADRMLPANARRAQAEHDVATSKAELAFRQAAHGHAVARADEAEASVAVAVATGERAKLDALLAERDPLTPDQIKRKAAFEEQLARAKGSLAEEGARVERTKAAMEEAEESWKALAAQKP